MPAAKTPFEESVQELVTNPLFRLRVALLAIPVSWSESAELTRREMVAIATLWNEMHEDSRRELATRATDSASVPEPRGHAL